LSTKPHDLLLSNSQIKTETNGSRLRDIKTEIVPLSRRWIKAYNHSPIYPINYGLPQPSGKFSGPLEPISVNASAGWSHTRSFLSAPYPIHTKMGGSGASLNFSSEPHLTHFGDSPPHASPSLQELHPFFPFVKREAASPPELRNVHVEGHNFSRGITTERLESRFPCHPPRDHPKSVIIQNHHHFPHLMNHHQRQTPSRSSCDSGVSSPTGSSTHSTTSTPSLTPTLVNGTLRYACPTCQKSYSTVSGLSKHVQFHCGSGVKKSFICKDCDKVYTSLGALKMHIRTHTLPCKCTVCGKAFSRPWLLQGHIRTHTGEKPFGCQHCQRAFADRSNLRAHLQTHSDLKKYSCKHCAKTFSRMSLLSKHQDTGCSTHSN